MKINTLIYLIKEGMTNLWTSRKTAISSFVIILATMLILGVFMLITVNVDHIVATTEESQGIQVILEEVTENDRLKIENEIKNIFGVSTVTYISKDEALQSVIDSVDEEYKPIYEELRADNPYPASYIVKLTDLEKSSSVQDTILKIPNVKKIAANNKTAQMISDIGRTVNTVIIIILAILLATSIFIISNAIKITMFARRKEISIMKYVGATDGFIRLPFIIEGMIIGLVGAAIATLIVGLSYTSLYNNIQQTNEFSIVPFSGIVQNLIIIYIILGVGIGIIGSTVSIKKYLDV